MLSRRIASVAVYAVTAFATLAGCGNPPTIVGSWASTTTASATLQTDWSFKFTADSTFTLSLVTTNAATSGRGAGCVATVTTSGVYTAVEPTLTVTAQSGAAIYERCLNSAENTASMALSAANLAMFSSDFSGPFAVVGDQLTVNTPPSGVGPGVLTRR